MSKNDVPIFDSILANAREFGDFLTVEELFGEVKHYLDHEMPTHARALNHAAAAIHDPADSFIITGTTQTEVVYEAFRRAFYDRTWANQLGSLDIAVDPRKQGYVTARLLARLHAEQEARGLPQTAPLPFAQSNVVSLNRIRNLRNGNS